MPKSVMKPMTDGMLTTFDERKTAKTPPISANGRFTKINALRGTLRNSLYNKQKIMNKATMKTPVRVREADLALSNCPP